MDDLNSIPRETALLSTASLRRQLADDATQRFAVPGNFSMWGALRMHIFTTRTTALF
jgi:hypothetical protein